MAATFSILRCPACGKKFRLKVAAGARPTCPGCGGPLSGGGEKPGTPERGAPAKRPSHADRPAASDVLAETSSDEAPAPAPARAALSASQAATRIEPKQKLGGYEILGKVGEGAMGVVYRALDPQLERHIAIKVLRNEMVANSEVVRRFRQEAEAIASLRHPFIVHIYDFRQEGALHYFTMDFVEGRTLEDLIESGELALPDKLELFTRFLRALGHAHKKQVIHRDIKPSNIIVDGEKNPHITDFGLAKSLERPSQLTREGQPLGTPMYMSPEQIRGRAELVDRRSDLYSAGVVFYQLLAGKLPYQASTSIELFEQIVSPEPVPVRGLSSRIPKRIREIAIRALSKDPDQRYQDADAWADDLEPFLREGGKRGDEEGGLLRHVRPQVLAGLACILVTFLVMAGLVVAEAVRSPERELVTGPAPAKKDAPTPTPTPPKPGGSGPVPPRPDRLRALFKQVQTRLAEKKYPAVLDTLVQAVEKQDDLSEPEQRQLSRQLRTLLLDFPTLRELALLSPQKVIILCRSGWGEGEQREELKDLAARLYNAAAPGVGDRSTAEQAVALLETSRYLGHETADLYYALARGYGNLGKYAQGIEQVGQYFFQGGKGRDAHLLRGKLHYAYGEDLARQGKTREARAELEKAIPSLTEALKAESGTPALDPQKQLEAAQMWWAALFNLQRLQEAMALVGRIARASSGNAYNPFTVGVTDLMFQAANSRLGGQTPVKPAYRWSFQDFRVEADGPISGTQMCLLPKTRQFDVLQGPTALMFYFRGNASLELKFRMPSAGRRYFLRISGECPGNGGGADKNSAVTISIDGQALVSEQQILPSGKQETREWDITDRVTAGKEIPLKITLAQKATLQFWLYQVEVVGR